MNDKITIENICHACEKGGRCGEPCEDWYKLLEGKPVDLGWEGGET